MPSILPLPDDVIAWIHDVFATCNQDISTRLSRMPDTYESALDMALIDEISRHAAPVILGSGWTVRIDTHFLGGRRHFYSWEVADVGLLVLFRRGGTLLRSKVGLLQSKRLYPVGSDLQESTADDFRIGFGRLYESEETFLRVTRARRVRFADQSRYRALRKEDNQYDVIRRYEQQVGIPVYYLLYNPLRVPWSITLPRRSTRSPRGPCQAGCRVVPSAHIRDALQDRDDGYSPSYGDLRFLLDSPFDTDTEQAGWRLEHFVAQLLVKCREGHVAEDPGDRALFRVFNRREGPISAAIAVTFDAPAA